jgi:hypothetical protein
MKQSVPIQYLVFARALRRACPRPNGRASLYQLDSIFFCSTRTYSTTPVLCLRSFDVELLPFATYEEYLIGLTEYELLGMICTEKLARQETDGPRSFLQIPPYVQYSKFVYVILANSLSSTRTYEVIPTLVLSSLNLYHRST